MRSAQRTSSDAYKQHLHTRLEERHANLSFAQEQRRLRIHLRRILLANGHQTPPASAGPSRRVPTTEQFAEWKDAALTRQRHRQRQREAARVIQAAVRKWIEIRRLHEPELPSESAMVGMPTLPRPPPPYRSNPVHADPSANTPPHESDPPASPDAPFVVIIELLGVRDLPTVLPQELGDDVHVMVNVCLLRRPGNAMLGQFVTPTTPMNPVVWQWEDQFIQIGVDPDSGIDRFNVVQDCSVIAEVSLLSNAAQRLPIGRVVLAMDLLETPLAENYAMTGWFPLEKIPGRSTGPIRVPLRGEIRLGVRYMMRNGNATRDDDGDVWVPYSPPPTPASTEVEPTRPVRRMHRRPVTKTSVNVADQKPPLSPRKVGVAANPGPSPTRKPKPRSPVRPARVEVISPPSSPSSYSSDSNMFESDDSVDDQPPTHEELRSPEPPLRRGSTGGIVRRRASQQASPENQEPLQTQTSTGHSPKPRFLKHKPYKVVFQKLDWSKVGSKTDSNWGTSTAKSAVPSSPKRAGPGNNTQASTRNADATLPVDDDRHRRIEQIVASVSTEVLAACKLTVQTAPLAHMKFKSERKRLVQALQPHASTVVNDTAVQELWTTLHGDGEGAEYTALLQKLQR